MLWNKKLAPCPKLVIVIKTPPKPSVLEFLTRQHKSSIEIFSLRELAFNVTKHIYVPNHTLLSKTEVKELLERFKMKSTSCLSRILTTDPVVRYYGLSVGHVLRVDRPTPAGHSFRNWRVVSRVPLK